MLDEKLTHLQKESRKQHRSLALYQARDHHLRLRRVILEKQLLHQSRLHRNHLGEKDKTKERGVNRTHTVAAIGTTQGETMEDGTGDNITRPLHRSWR